MPSKPIKILVADDDKALSEAFSGIIRQLGHDCDVVHDGTRCLEMLGRSGYDLLFADLIMPGMDVLSVLGQIKRRGLTTRVVVVSAQDDPTEIQELLDGGAMAYLIKPVKIDSIQQALDRISVGDTERSTTPMAT